MTMNRELLERCKQTLEKAYHLIDTNGETSYQIERTIAAIDAELALQTPPSGETCGNGDHCAPYDDNWQPRKEGEAT